MTNHNNIYNILGKLDALNPKEEPKGNLLKEIQHPAKKDVVSQLNDRYATFKQRLNESQVNELSPALMQRAAKKAGAMVNKSYQDRDYNATTDYANQQDRIQHGMDKRAGKSSTFTRSNDYLKNEPGANTAKGSRMPVGMEEEQVNELSPKTLGSYAKKAAVDAKFLGHQAGAQQGDAMAHAKHPGDGVEAGMELDDKAHKRLRGVHKAVNKLSGIPVKENRVDSPVSSAITRRILNQRHDLLKYGPQAVMDAIDQVADWVDLGPDDEIGSSDVSAWVSQVERYLRSSAGEGIQFKGIDVAEGSLNEFAVSGDSGGDDDDDEDEFPQMFEAPFTAVINGKKQSGTVIIYPGEVTSAEWHTKDAIYIKTGMDNVHNTSDFITHAAEYIQEIIRLNGRGHNYVKHLKRRGGGVAEGETIHTKTGLIHKGTYGSDYDEQGSDDDYDEHGNKKTKAAGRPKKDKAPERVTGKAWKHKDGRQTTESFDDEEEEDPMSFTHGANINGTSLVGHIQASYDQLVQVFGEPDIGPDDRNQDKVTCVWELQFGDGTVATIYDWKEGETPMGPYRWHIGGRNTNAEHMIHSAFEMMHEGETIPTKTGLIHKGTYGSDWEDPEGKEDSASNEPKKSGRPKKDKAPERVTGKAWKHKDGRVAESFKIDSIVEDTMAELDSILLAEKAVSQQQQKFMGMVHAMQTGHKVKGASSELKKVAKDMGKKDAEDFASTKHAGLPKKVNESMAFECEDPGVKAICHRYGKEVNDFTQSGNLDPDLYHALHDHYYDSMPSGVKRGSNTQEWVGHKFSQDMGMGQPATVEADRGDMAAVMDESGAFYPGRTVYWRGKAGHVDRVEGNKCFVHLASGDMDVWPTRECDTEKQSFMSTLGKDIKDIGHGMKGFLTGGPEERSELDELARLAGLGKHGHEVDECTYTAEGEHCPVHGMNECGMGMYEAKEKKADKDYDGDGKIESGKDEYLGSKIRAAKKATFKESAGSIDFDKVLAAIAALYGDDIWDNDAMQDLANDLEQAGPTDRELDFIIARGKLPKRLAGIQFSAGDDVRFNESKPDFLDVDKDGNKKEPFKKAVKDKEEDDKLDEAMSELRRLSGMSKSTREHVAHAIPNMYAFEKTVTEEFANEPDEQYVDTDTIVNQGNDLNRKKSQYSGKPRAGDNPMTGDDIQMEARLARLYNSIKVANK